MTRPVDFPPVGDSPNGSSPAATGVPHLTVLTGGRGQPAYLVHLNLLAEKIALFLGGADSYLVCPPALDDPYLTISVGLGVSLKVEVNIESGFYFLHECCDGAGSVVVTSSEDRLLDHVFGYLSGSASGIAPQALDTAVDFFVGRSLGEMEWRLIVGTLRRFHGDLARAATALGISTECLRAKVHAHLDTLCSVARSSDEFQ